MNSFRTSDTLYRVFWCILLLNLQNACSRPSGNETAEKQEPVKDSSIVRYAKGFQLEDKDNYQLLSIHNPFQPGTEATQYALVKRGMAPPQDFPADRVISIPVKSIAVTSSLHVGAITQLEAWDYLIAIGDGNQVYSEAILERLKKGQIAEIQKGAKLNEEKVIELQPDILMVTGSGEGGSGTYSAIHQAGIPVLVNSEWMENTPLGRAEWIKLMAVLLDRLNFSQHQFARIETNYQDLAEKARENKGKQPGVLLGNEFQGTWHMPGGKSFQANLLADAGADYFWKANDQSGSIPLNYESVYPVALNADVWLNIYLPSPGDGKKQLLATDSRYAEFKSVKNNRLYSFTKRINEQGANDYWESAAFRPDLLMADYLHIFHPEILPVHDLYFYKKLD